MVKQAQVMSGQAPVDARRPAPPGEDPGTLTDEEYLSIGGPDAMDAAAPASAQRTHDAHRNPGHPEERTDEGPAAG